MKNFAKTQIFSLYPLQEFISKNTTRINQKEALCKDFQTNSTLELGWYKRKTFPFLVNTERDVPSPYTKKVVNIKVIAYFPLCPKRLLHQAVIW